MNSARFYILALSTFLVGCSGMVVPNSTGNTSAGNANTLWSHDGMMTVARMAPAPQAFDQEVILGFFPGSAPALISPAVSTMAQHEGKWLSIDRTQGQVKLMEGSVAVDSFAAEGIQSLPAGAFQLALKQRNPLWYAPDSYFTSREIGLPASGDKNRFRKGALGEFALFIDKDNPIHSGPVWSQEVGGIRLDENDLSRIYYQIEVGSPVEIR